MDFTLLDLKQIATLDIKTYKQLGHRYKVVLFGMLSRSQTLYLPLPGERVWWTESRVNSFVSRIFNARIAVGKGSGYARLKRVALWRATFT